jgi:hypothetical protein
VRKTAVGKKKKLIYASENPNPGSWPQEGARVEKKLSGK